MRSGVRTAYLKAMDIDVWRSRIASAEADAASLEMEAGLEQVRPQQIANESFAEPVSAQPEAAPLRSLAGEPDWPQLREQVASCNACELCQSRTQTVFGVGDEQADLMIIGEAPGADEDRQGEPFVGRAGKLLNEMLLAIGLQRERVFIANILKCRPPGNRDPKPEEASKCRPFLDRQIELLKPGLILSVGRISAQNLLHTDAPVGKLRGRVHHLTERRIPLVVTYHPAYLLRSPEQKAKAWQDLQLALSQLRRPG